MKIAVILFVLAVSILVFLPWKDVKQEDLLLLQQFQETLKNDSSLISIVSFNIRLDAEENNSQVIMFFLIRQDLS